MEQTEELEVVSSSIEDLSNNEAAKVDDGILEYSSFAKGDSWAHIVWRI